MRRFGAELLATAVVVGLTGGYAVSTSAAATKSPSGAEAFVTKKPGQKALDAIPVPDAAVPSKPPPSRPCPTSNCFEPSAGRTYKAFLRWTGNDVAKFWKAAFGELPWKPARTIQIDKGKAAKSKCVPGQITANPDVGPFYCSADGPGTVFLPTVWLKDTVFPHTSFRVKDFALSYVVAHEWGHHVQHLLGIGETVPLKSIQIELQADCLAGIWAYSTWARKLLEAGDIEKAINQAELFGDAPGSSPDAADAHGSGAQRATWFKRGYYTGDASKCKTG